MCSGKRFGFPFVFTFLLVVFSSVVVYANFRDVRPQRPLPPNLTELQLDSPLTVAGIGNVFNLKELEHQTVIVQLEELPLARVVKTDRFSFTTQLNQRSRIYAEQQRLIDEAERLDPDVQIFGKVWNALNAVMLEIDTAVLPQLAAYPDVVAVWPIVDYEIELTDTAIVHIANGANNSDYDGSGVSVAILDSGIDYHHLALGGSGNPNDYLNNNPFIVEPGSFPTNKVVGGFDFVGSRWLNSDFGRNSLLRSDPDPIDSGIIAGHGTRIADVIGGNNGLAPGVDLYAVRVCTSHTTACSGIALMMGLDFVLDPNRDGYIDDAVDIVNLSIQAKKSSLFDNSVIEALENISRVGVLAVGTAGNGVHQPYAIGSPGVTPTLLTVGTISPGTTPYLLETTQFGPAYLQDLIKPELVAPAIMETAVAGTGQGRNVAGDTVTAVPIVAAHAALLMEAYPDRNWQEIKAVLINSANTNVNVSESANSGHAAITQIGGGEVQLDSALSANGAVWDAAEQGRSVISFGFHEVNQSLLTLRKQIRIHNYANEPVRYNLSTTFRYENDATNGAVSIWTPGSIRIPANSSATFPVVMRINGNLLRPWSNLFSPNRNASADIIRLGYDGYIWFDDVSTTSDNDSMVHLPWHILPRRGGRVVLNLAQGDIKLMNEGMTPVDVSTYSLIGVSGNQMPSDVQERFLQPDLRFVGYSTTMTESGVCGDARSFLLAFALNTWRSQPIPTESLGMFKIDLDTDQDGTIDYSIVNHASILPDSWSGRPMSWVLNWDMDTATANFYVDVGLHSDNIVFYVCGSQIGMNELDFFNPIDIQVSILGEMGEPIDTIDAITISPLGEQYMATFSEAENSIISILANSNRVMNVLDFGFLTNNSETGLLLLYKNGANGRSAVAFEISP